MSDPMTGERRRRDATVNLVTAALIVVDRIDALETQDEAVAAAIARLDAAILELARVSEEIDLEESLRGVPC